MSKSRQHVPAKHLHRELLPDQSLALLQMLRLLTPDGRLNADSRRKLKQINHFANLLRPGLEALFADGGEPLLVDAGAGNAYLGFVLYELFFGSHGAGQVVGIELRGELVEQARERAAALGYERLSFVHGAVDPVGAELPARVDAVVALHACDTATDDALLLALRTRAPFVAVVPCCQTEVYGLLQGSAGRHVLGPLWRHGMHRREFGAHLTNVIRAHVLEMHGYQVTVTELVGWEHSLKNELILARRHQRADGQARRRLEALLASLPPLSMKLLNEAGPAALDAIAAAAPQPHSQTDG